MNISGWVQLQFDCKCFKFLCLKSVLKISEHVEICNACCKHIEKECYNNNNYNNNLFPSHLQVSLTFFVMVL